MVLLVWNSPNRHWFAFTPNREDHRTFNAMRPIFNRQIARLLKLGKSPREIVSLLDCSNACVTYWNKRLGRPLFKRGRRIGPNDPIRTDRVITLRQDGLSAAYIARLFAISRQRVDQIISPEKQRARSTAARMIRYGYLKRPKRCSNCGKKRSIDAHHPDHNDQKSVRWLCKKCHYRADAQLRRKNRLTTK